MASAAQRLRDLLNRPSILTIAGCYDGISAKLVEQAGFDATFMSGFGVSAVRLGLPDTGLISYEEMLSQGRAICAATHIPVLGDGDTGYGNPLNIKRTVQGYAQAGFACIMIEDQVAPKRCGHTQGKQVVDRHEARQRIQAALDAKAEGADILIMARTDARATHGIEEALYRAQMFADMGVDINFLEAPQNIEEMQRYCRTVHGFKMANMIEQGKTPVLPVSQLEEMGYKIAVYPLTALSASIFAMQQALMQLKQQKNPENLLSFEMLKEIVGFNEYYRAEEKYH